MSIIFAAPIPGQSLTSEPKNLPFERPPETADPYEALNMHIDHITQPKALKSAFHFMEEGLDLVSLVEGVLRSAVMAGKHSLDVSLVIAPVLHEYIRGLAIDAEVEFKEGFEEDQEEEDGIQYQRDSERALKMLREMKKEKGMPVEEVQQEPQEEVMVEPEEETEVPQGLMARRI